MQAIQLNVTCPCPCSMKPSNKVQKLSASASPGGLPKRLRFSETAQVMVVRKVRYGNWLNKSEIREFKRDVHTSALAKTDLYSQVMRTIGYSVQQGTTSPEFKVEEDVRGLEHLLSPEVTRVLIQRRKMTIDQVLKEQERQLLFGEHDPEKIAMISQNNSSFVVEWRRRIAEL
ncbi:hypothetical protein ACHAWO_003183 [Cyclotella atomus]|uniref:Trigger factor C-terminal domain-containing protein n=1 Tax=Cyclotella atomus TaxID=382360 RepID=A0ABD3PKD5_9STRA